MVNVLLVRRKLVKLDGYLNELDDVKRHTFEDYVRNYQIRRSAERLLQLVTDAAADINTHIIVDGGFPPPPDSYQSFIELAKLDVYPAEFAYQIAPATGERNILVHEYEQIDDRIVYDSIPQALDLFRRYIAYLQAFLHKK